MSKMAGLNRLVASSQGKRTESFTVLARKLHHEAPLLAKGQATAAAIEEAPGKTNHETRDAAPCRAT